MRTMRIKEHKSQNADNLYADLSRWARIGRPVTIVDLTYNRRERQWVLRYTNKERSPEEVISALNDAR